LSLSRAFFPVVVMILIALVAIPISLGLTNSVIKKSNHKLSHHSVDIYLNNVEDFQNAMVLDYTEWGDTFTKLTVNNDIAWFSYSIGGANLLNNKIHGLAFIKNDGTILRQHTRNKNKSFSISHDIFMKDFAFVKNKLLENRSVTPSTFSYYQNVNNIPTMISFSPITYPDPKAYPDFNPDHRDFLVFWTVLTPKMLAKICDKLQLEGLSITAQPSPDDYILKDSQGHTVARLQWALKKEKANPLAILLFTSLAMFMLLLIGGYITFSRLSELIQQLDIAKSSAERGHKIKSEFLATMSHELRTPLNSIIGFSDILQYNAADNFTDTQVEYLNHIQSSGKHLLIIINEILDMSKIEAGKYEIKEEEMDICRTIKQALIFLQKNANDKNITLVEDLPSQLNEFMGDAKVIKQTIMNLLSNSVKFTPENGQITVGCHVNEAGGMVLYVEDNGIGISAEKIGHITEPYLQDQNHKTRSHQGTGLGLAITKAFVDMHQGTMEIQSEMNKGTRVTITFPAARVLPDIV